MSTDRQRSPDVVVVGAGPAGLSSAIACAQSGLEVVVLERHADLPIDKACGEGLMPDAVAALGQLGVTPKGHPISGIRYSDEHSVALGSFDPNRVGLGLGVRRTELSRALKERAESVGVRLRTGDGFMSLGAVNGSGLSDLESASGRWHPKVIVGADGARSAVRAACGLSVAGAQRSAVQAAARRRVGLRAHFKTGAVTTSADPPARPVEVYWTNGAEAYLTPVDDETFGLAFLFNADAGAASVRKGHQGRGDQQGEERGAKFDQLLGLFPTLRQRMASAERVTRARGVGPLRHRARSLTRGNVALVGDAGGYVDAITGEGMAIAFAEALQLAQALTEAKARLQTPNATLAAVARYRLRATRRRRLPDLLTEGALRLSRRPRVRRRFLAALERKPAVFDRMLALHARALNDRAAVGLALELGWRMVLGR